MVAFNSQLIQDKQKFWDEEKRLWHELDKKLTLKKVTLKELTLNELTLG